MSERKSQEQPSVKNLFLNVTSKNKCHICIWSDIEYGSTIFTFEDMLALRKAINKSIIDMKFNRKT